MIATSRWKKLVTIGASATLAIAIPVCLLVYLLIQEPPYYSQVNDLSPEHRALESRQFMQQTTAIVNQVENQAAWSGVFRDMQLNAWLASDFARKHADVLPEGITEPRVSFCDGVLSLAFRWQRGPVTIVVSASGQVWLPEPNFLAFELRSAQAGRLPIPKAYVIRSVTEAARSAGLDLNWKRHESQPVALLQFNSSTRLSLDKVDLKDGMLFLAGRCRSADVAQTEESVDRATDSSDVSWNVQSPDALRRK